MHCKDEKTARTAAPPFALSFFILWTVGEANAVFFCEGFSANCGLSALEFGLQLISTFCPGGLGNSGPSATEYQLYLTCGPSQTKR